MEPLLCTRGDPMMEAIGFLGAKEKGKSQKRKEEGHKAELSIHSAKLRASKFLLMSTLQFSDTNNIHMEESPLHLNSINSPTLQQEQLRQILEMQRVGYVQLVLFFSLNMLL